MLGVVEEVTKMLFILRLGLARALDPLASEACLLVQDTSQSLPNVGMFTQFVGDDVPDAE